MTFFEWGVAELAGVPHHRTWLMIHDAGPLGLRAIYERAGLPARLFPAFRAAVDTFHALEFDGGARDLERFQQRMLQRFLTQPTPPRARTWTTCWTRWTSSPAGDGPSADRLERYEEGGVAGFAYPAGPAPPMSKAALRLPAIMARSQATRHLQTDGVVRRPEASTSMFCRMA